MGSGDPPPCSQGPASGTNATRLFDGKAIALHEGLPQHGVVHEDVAQDSMHLGRNWGGGSE